MYNGFLHKRLKGKELKIETDIHKNAQIKRAASTNVDMYRTQSLARTNQWIRQNQGTKTEAVLAQGSTLLVHPEQHNFRDYSPMGSVYVRKYVPEKTRVLLTTTQYFHGHYIQEPFNTASPNIQKGRWLRPRNKPTEIGDHMTYKEVNEIKRVQDSVNEIKVCGEPIDPKQLTQPEWRQANRARFLTKKGFDLRLRTKFAGKFDRQVWKTREEYALGCEYKGGYEETGNICRGREKNKEVARKCFDSASPRDTWYDRLNQSTSIRKYISDKVLEQIEANKQRLHSMIDIPTSPTKVIDGTNENLFREGTTSSIPDYERIDEKKEEHDHDEKCHKRAVTSTNPGGLKPEELRSVKTGYFRPLLAKKYSIPRPETKVYKKSLENHYFVNNASPAKDALNKRSELQWTHLNLSSTHIIKQQLTNDHWTSEFNGGMQEVIQKLKEDRNIKTPAENFKSKFEGFDRYASPSRIAKTRDGNLKYRLSTGS